MKKYIFSSKFAVNLEDFITHKRAIGYAYQTAAWTLKGFDEFCFRLYPEEQTLSRILILHWAERRSNETIGTLHQRVAVVRQFALYMKKIGQKVYIIPRSILPTYQHYVPHIYSRKELSALFAWIDSCSYWPGNPIRNKAIPLIFRLLYCCGLRVSEVCSLQLKDVDLNTGVLTIQNSKNSKDRYIPLSDKLTFKCHAYYRDVHAFSNSEAYLFPSRNGRILSKAAVYGSFRQFLWQARISHGGKGKGPRLHDLRHTFAVHCLKRWTDEGRDLAAYLPVLKTYLGHTHFQQTAYYLRLTGDVFPSITTKIEKCFGGLIPKAGACHETH